MSTDTPLAKLISRKRDLTDLATVGITTLEDALRHFPRTYVVPGEVTPLDALVPDTVAVVSARVVRVTAKQLANRKSLTTVVLSDGLSDVEAPFFNQPWIANTLTTGRHVALTGKVTLYRGTVQIASPRWLNPTGTESLDDEDLSVPIPVYRATSTIATTRIQRLIRVLLDTAPPEAFADPIADEIRAVNGLPDYRTALEWMHRPVDEHQPQRARRRWKFEEAYALQAELLSRKALAADDRAIALPGAGAGDGDEDGAPRSAGLLGTFDAGLPFALTGSQHAVGDAIATDLAGEEPMNRLLHGDVGSGKTLVALRAMLQAVDSGAQAALLAPTEVLAAQHHRSLLRYLGGLAEPDGLFDPSGAAGDLTTVWAGAGSPGARRVRVGLLTGSLSTAERKRLLLDLVSGRIDILVGTHALLSDTTMFSRLGLVVVDEQHRFGVRQRESLRAKGGDRIPHTLVMTATPIPRTVAMTVFGDLDVSVLSDMPGGTREITSHAVSLDAHPRWLGRILEIVGESGARGEQTFIVASRIETQPPEIDAEGEPVPEVLGVDDLVARVQEHPAVAGLRVASLHGRMDAAHKDTVMRRFAAGEIDVLVATTVIEVGIDVPNARTMVVYDADRFGVAQLHQLRGRVGRDGSAATCFLVTRRAAGSEAMERLETVAATLDGFALAEYDVEQRREGDVLGRAQSGRGSSLRHLSVIRDVEIIEQAREAARQVVAADPGLTGQPALRAAIDRILGAADEDWIEAG
ncbi:ATP-dependent DNA helicase RecG [uncultured Brevibacterium sp.]|uniref:ATP-dependent DNA helicase RecG n=1 Tax=uncultured Brevibacterium sp. TaxID=189678 RepID=UPI0025D744BD|nr:ATP-dependent DNA helicase RecG [uncultured Brevibacterium sp.]